MRGHDDVGQAEQRVLLGRLLGEHVEGRAGDVAVLERVRQRLLVDEAAARAVDDPHALLRLGEVLAAQDVLRLLRQRHVQGDEVGARQQRVEPDLLDTELGGALLRQERIVGDHLHPQPHRAGADDAADVARADHAERLAGQLDAHEARLLPLARMGRGRRLGDLARDGEHHRDGVLGGGDHVAEGGVHHDDALLRRVRDVDVIDADAGAADDPEVVGGGDDLLGDLGRRADGEAVVLADHLEQLVLVLAEVGLEVDVDAAVAEDLHGGFGELVGNENAGSHITWSLHGIET
ncbi:hypothetical protein OG2516_09735 [Oceanicola granulosus HTCC2516]|uniref:Uncharacterized protein n=1 Tax=Oceanicola granulosus (strain ATCC BAA-861 / DSM 15982 / KCTC 12143 / HTCC2516) TaxID=314256 RepID=Q2CCV7_OCEGH|nr:hypothetical protein OG2516_09735 [Oceanicola granulosus HTCC2516]